MPIFFPLPQAEASNAPLSLGPVEIPAEVRAWEPVDLRVPAAGTWANPFDPEQAALDVQVSPPTGDSYTLPGFWSRDYRRTGNDLVPVGESGWRVRLTPRAQGRYRLTFRFRDRTGGTVTREAEMRVQGGSPNGFVRVSPRDGRYFVTADGRSFYPLGANVSWGERGLADYDRWFPKWGAQGSNWIRLWLSPAWATFALETRATGLGAYDLQNAYRLDEALRLGAAHGLSLQLCIESFNILRDRDSAPFWEQTPHNAQHGGPLRIWKDFWTEPKMDRLFRNKLRYLVARYSAFPNLFGWEFWNEVDLTRDYDEEIVRGWHERMGRSLKALDPYDHPVTTSTASTNGARSIDLLPEIDYLQSHHYGTDPAGTVFTQATRKGILGKPHFFGEIGADATGPRADVDPRGIQIHDPVWASLATGSSGGAMAWWWDNYIDPRNLYPILGTAARFAEGIDWPGEGFRLARPSLSYVTPPAQPRRKDATLGGGPATWAPARWNRPALVRFQNGRFSGDLPLSGILHGTGNHPNLHNPVRFLIRLNRPAKFIVDVGQVSGYGGGKLAVSLNDKRVLTRDFVDPDGTTNTGEITRYAGAYAIDLPKGNHTVKVENLGTDWFNVGYRLTGVLEVSTPPVMAYATTGERTAILWARVEDAIWRLEAERKMKPASAPPTVLRLPGLSAGRWEIQRWDTWAGRVMSTTHVTVGLDGVLRTTLPAFNRDLALKMRKETN